MEKPDIRFSELVDIVKSWIPRRSESATVSRDFWMPDQSCRVCYECDQQFTIFNRRHHCRLCGRVFCSKCTSNSVPVSYGDLKNVGEEAERMRVCNYCFKQRLQEVNALDNGVRASSPVLSPSLSTTSLASTKSSSTGNSSTTTVASVSYSTGGYRCVSYGSGPPPIQSIQMENCPEKQDLLVAVREMDPVTDTGDPFPNQYGFCMNRSDDDDDDEYNACRSDSETQHFHTSVDYYGPHEFVEVDQGYNSNKVHAAEEKIVANDASSPVCDKMAEEARPENGYECGVSSSIYGLQVSDAEPVDFENNVVLWLPPEPEDEEDERELVLFDDDDEDATGEWGYMRSSNSFGSGEYRSRDQSSEEHRKAMKNVVDGHFRALIAQLLEVENLSVAEENEKESWLEIITALSWEAANFLKPDTSKGGGMDPGGYVKIKCIACGRRSESMVVKGVVCKKNIANRFMTSKIDKPRFLILGGALEYQRVTNLLSSVDTLLQQEMDHLKMAVAKIDAHHPNVLLVEKTVSSFAKDYLLAKNISLVLNIKRPLLERIARCTSTQIVPSIDHLSSQKLGHCEFFHVEKFYEEHGSARQGGKKLTKTLMFFEGCPKPLGCTILLRGANGDELKKIKHVIQYGVFAAYHLALETSFLADEGASLPELPLKSPITVALPDKPPSIDRSISTVAGFTAPSVGKPQHASTVPSLTSCNFGKFEAAMSSFSSEIHNSQISDGASAFTSPVLMEGSPLVKSNQDEHIVELQSRVPSGSPCAPRKLSNSSPHYFPSGARKEKIKVGFLEHPEAELFKTNEQTIEDIPETINNSLNFFGTFNSGRFMADVNQKNDYKHMIGKEPGSSLMEALQPDNNQIEQHTLMKEEFPPSPSDHQSILVSVSSRCVWKGIVCDRTHLFRIKYYGNCDKPLGRFLRDHLFDQSYRCRSCEMPSEAHVHCYTHRQGSLTISVRKLPESLSGERDGKIWMWHRCLRCPRINGFPPATRRVVMSDAAWGLSFGKFLELSFSNHAAASRVASCGHSLHRDCLRFYGFGKMVACFRYASVNLHSVYLPPAKLDFNYKNQEWIQEEAKEVAVKSNLLFFDVLNALQEIEKKRIYNGLQTKCDITELEEILRKEKAEFEESLQKAVIKEAKKGEQVTDILEVNKLRRQLLFLSYFWDHRLVFDAGSDNSTHEVLSSFTIRNKEKHNFSEKSMEINLAPKTQRNFASSDISTPEFKGAESFMGSICLIEHQEGVLDHPNQPNVGQQRRDEQDSFYIKPSNLSPTRSSVDQYVPIESGFVVRRVLSEGQFPLGVDLSDTLDAKWTGENGPALVEGNMLNSSALVQAADALSTADDLGEPIGADVNQSVSFPLVTRCGNSAEDLPRWFEMPFIDFYRWLNKNWGNAPRFDSISEYNPVFISLFRELERQGGARLLLPIGVNDTVIPIYDDEPTSIISYALSSPHYHFQMSDDREKIREGGDSLLPLPIYDSGNFHSFHSVGDISLEPSKSFGSTDDIISSLSGSLNSMVFDPLTKAMHVRVPFSDSGSLGKVKYTVTCYYAKCFDSLRKMCCPSQLDFVRSLSRCKKWGAQGGKSNVFFAKSLDDRFIIKQVTKTELESFIKFAPEYFKYLSESISTGSPTCLAKILGIFQVMTKHLKGGKETRMDVLVMENLLFGRNVTRLYDLKGSSRSRYNSDSSGNNKVLLDQNLIEAMPTSPIFVGNKAKRLLERAVWNDTAFLASIDVMDYSLLVGVDEEKHELALGIIDFMRQYTWDKHLETWVKASGILGGPKNSLPTVVSPKQYKKRFRKAMSTYFLVVPDQWSPPAVTNPGDSQSDLAEDNQRTTSLEL